MNVQAKPVSKRSPGRDDKPELEMRPGCYENANRLAALTARAVRAPAAAIHLTQRGQLELVGYCGPSEPDIVESTLSLAERVTSRGFTVVINDAAQDARVVGDPAVDAAGIASYAGFPIRTPDGTITGVCSVFEFRPREWTADDLAALDAGAAACTAFVEEMALEAGLDEQRRFLDALLDSLRVGVAACDAEGRLVRMNAAALALGVTPGSELDVLRRALAGERLRDVELALSAADGSPLQLLADAQQIADEDGHALGAVVAMRDVTEQRRAERFRGCELAVSTALATAPSVEVAGPSVLEVMATSLGWPHGELWLVESATDLVRSVATYDAPGTEGSVAVPAELRIGQGLAGAAFVNDRVVWLNELTGSPLVAPDTAPGMRSALAVPVPSGGRTLAVMVFFAPTRETRQDFLVTLLTGIAAHVGQFLEHRRAEELALALARSKDEYLALVGHEMRTPLTSIAAYIDLLGELDTEMFASHGKRMLQALERNSNQLRHIVDQLLDLAALDAGHASIHAAPLDLSAMVRAAVGGHPELRTGGFALSVDVPDTCMVQADRVRLRQVIDALLSNAIAYSPEGGRIELAVRPDGSRMAELTVTDTGIGIPESERDALFGRFFRSSRARDRQIPGSGLALALSRAIIDRHGGSIVMVPGIEGGTRIRVHIPVVHA